MFDQEEEPEKDKSKEKESRYKSREKKLVEPFGVLVTRDEREKNFHDLLKPPPLGTYNPKPISKSVKVWRDYSVELDKHKPRKRKKKKFTFKQLMKGKKGTKSSKEMRKSGLKRGSNFTKSAKDLRMTDQDLRRPSEATIEFEKKSLTRSTVSETRISSSKTKIGFYERFPNRPVKGHVKFDLHTKRKPLNDQEIFDLDGKQFTYLDVPKVSSRFRPRETFFMKKKQPRGPLFGRIEPDNSDYQPKYEYGKKRINSGVLFFEPITKRKPPGRPSTTKNEALYDYDSFKKNNKSQFLKRVPQVDFEKNIPKEVDPESSLPSFMQKGRPLTANPLYTQMEKKDRKINKIVRFRPMTAKH